MRINAISRLLLSGMLMFFFWLGCFPSMAALKAEDTQPLRCSSSAELREFLQNTTDTEIVLDADICWEGESSIRVDQTKTVWMGDYGITLVAGQGIEIYGRGESPLFIGNGTKQPLFYLEAGEIEGIGVRVTGDGGTAVAAGSLTLWKCHIAMEGRDAVAVRTEGDVAIRGTTIEAREFGSSGVLCGGEAVVLWESVIIADRDAVVANAGLTVDFAYVEPRPAQGEIVHYRAVEWEDFLTYILPYDLLRYGLCVKQDDSLQLPEVLMVRCYALGEYGETQRRDINVSWSRLEAVDTSVPGAYIIQAELDVPLYMQMAVENLEPRDIPVRVVAPDKPYLVWASRHWWGYFLMPFLEEIEDAEQVLLFCSEDGGKTWADISDRDDVGISGQNITVGDIKEKKLYLFQARVVGGRFAGDSNRISVWYSKDGDIEGGDVDGGDQGDQGELPGTDYEENIPPGVDSSNPGDSGSGDNWSGGGSPNIDQGLVAGDGGGNGVFGAGKGDTDLNSGAPAFLKSILQQLQGLVKPEQETAGTSETAGTPEAAGMPETFGFSENLTQPQVLTQPLAYIEPEVVSDDKTGGRDGGQEAAQMSAKPASLTADASIRSSEQALAQESAQSVAAALPPEAAPQPVGLTLSEETLPVAPEPRTWPLFLGAALLAGGLGLGIFRWLRTGKRYGR